MEFILASTDFVTLLYQVRIEKKVKNNQMRTQIGFRETLKTICNFKKKALTFRCLD